jgi:two-component system CheB/CheR fusion protein
MNASALLADHLDSQTDAIIALWRSTVYREGDVPESESLTHREFLDHIPELLDRLAERLRGGGRGEADAEGRAHGRMRWRQGYDIGQVVRELGHLRTALVRATFSHAREHGFDLETLESILASIDDVLHGAMAEAVARFQDETIEQARTWGAEAEQRRLALEAERCGRESERRKFQALLENLPVGVWMADASGQVIALNPEAERLHQGEVPLSRAIRGETVHQEEVVWTRDTDRRIVLVNAAPIRDDAGAIVGGVAVAEDITARKRVEEHLRRQSGFTGAVTDSIAEGLYAIDREGRLTFMNPAAERMLGWTEGELAASGKGIHDAIHYLHADGSAYPAEDCPLWAAFRAGQVLRGDDHFVRKDGSRFPVVFTLSPIVQDGQPMGAVVTFDDITKRIELENALRKQHELAEEASRRKTRLVSALSHDARTPLNAVGLAAQLLELHFRDEADPEVVDCLRMIRHSVDNVQDLLGDLLSLSRLDAGVVTVEPTSFLLDAALAECLSGIEPQARLKGLACRLEIGALAGVELHTDRSKLKQIVSNLLSNALRYTARGRIRVFAERGADRVRIGVEDTGPGIHPADHQRIFEEFATLEDPQRPTGEGSGLGLSICQRLAHLLGGEIGLTSAVGRGSTFCLSLPASVVVGPPAAASGAAHDSRANPPTPAAPGGTGSILIAEDHLASRQALARVLKRLGYRPLEASNGSDAIALARCERPLAILMDVSMPVMDGIDATILLRADPATCDLPIFALTGDVTQVTRDRIGQAGINGFLEKPVTPEALHRALASLRADS